MNTVNISLLTMLEGAEYREFFPGWWEAAQSIDPKPREIVIVVHQRHRKYVQDIVRDQAHVVTLDEPFGMIYLRTAMANATSEWISWCSIDDRMLPNAFKELANYRGDAEVLVSTIILSTGQT